MDRIASKYTIDDWSAPVWKNLQLEEQILNSIEIVFTKSPESLKWQNLFYPELFISS